jgi:hypothetical protein
MSGLRKGLSLQSPTEIYELIVDTDSDEARIDDTSLNWTRIDKTGLD